MGSDKCKNDVNGPEPLANPEPCLDQAPGVDPKGLRWKVLSNWIKQMKDYEDNIKIDILLFPFSGGKFQTEREKTLNSTYSFQFNPNFSYDKCMINQLLTQRDLMSEPRLQFTKPSQALKEIQWFQSEQDCEDVSETRVIGTSIPLKPYTQILTKLDAEIEKQLASKKLKNTIFEFYFISDGQLLPLDSNYALAMNLANCPDPDYPAGPRGCDIGIGDKIEGPCFCYVVEKSIKEYWGDPKDNDPSKMFDFSEGMKAVIRKLKYYSQGRFYIHNVQLGKQASPLYDHMKEKIPFVQNILWDMEKLKSFENNLDQAPEVAAMAPHVVFYPNFTSFKVDRFYVVNLNAKQNEEGQWIPDSDGDGLSDDEEKALGFDPLDPMTKDEAGLRACLDGIKTRFGCRTSGCDALMDEDGDGLNSCEEKSIGTQLTIKDSSGDGIIDTFKALKRLIPLHSSYEVDSNSDGFTDGQAFELGLLPFVDLRKYSDSSKILSSITFEGYESFKNIKGEEKTRPKYHINIKQIPLVNTLEFKTNDVFYWDRWHSDPIKNNEFIRTSSHEASVNQIFFVIKVRSYENPEKIAWLLKKQNITFGSTENVIINLEDFSYLRGNVNGL